MRAATYTFYFNREPVGYFDRVPDAPGPYPYEAFRGPGHYHLHLALESDGTAHCLGRINPHQWIEFDIVGKSDEGELLLANIASIPPPQAE